ncbi:MAG: FAD-dependent oxidoreductase [Leptospirillum sp.]|jgi:ferredoxin-NADP reductase|nr:FAD-dependent oxidoreductase [Nitrospiraceae bacterium]
MEVEVVGSFRRVGLVADRTLFFQVELPGDVMSDFRAGQFCYLEWPDKDLLDDKGNGRNFSISSPPGELPVLSFATRLTGSAFKNALASRPDGSPIRVNGPYGDFCLSDCSTLSRTNSWDKPVVLVAGGIGVTPFRSMLMEALPVCGSVPFFLFTVNHSLESSVFREEFEKMARDNRNLYLDQIISRAGPDPLPPGIEVGTLTPGRLFDFIGVNAKKGEYYIAGGPSMVSGFKEALLREGVSSDRIHSDPFMGYR